MVVVVHNSVAPSNEEWDQYIKALYQASRLYGGDLSVCRQFVVTDGGGPNSAQRALALKAAEDLHGAPLMPVAVLSSSMFVRGIVTAFNWFNMNLRAFSPKELDSALSFLQIDETTLEEIFEELGIIQEEIGPVETIEHVRAIYEQRASEG